jgi:hypothetical protein
VVGEPPCGAHSSLSAYCSGFNLYGIAEVDSVEDCSPLILDVNAVMEHYAAFIFGHFSKRDASASHSMCSRSLQIS